MFRRLYTMVFRTMPARKFVLTVTVVTLGGVSVAPYFADRLIRDYDDVMYENVIQRERIRGLQSEIDSLQRQIRFQNSYLNQAVYDETLNCQKRIARLKRKMDSAFVHSQRVTSKQPAPQVIYLPQLVAPAASVEEVFKPSMPPAKPVDSTRRKRRGVFEWLKRN